MRGFGLLTPLLVGCVAIPVAAADLYVSPTGNDANQGTQAQPLATLSAARDAAQLISDEPVTVHVAGGTYYLDKPLRFSPADSRVAEAPLVFQALAGQSPVISGGQPLNLSWQAYRDGIQRATVPSGLEFDQLFLNGQRQHMARWPNYDPDAQYFQGSSAECTAPERIARWADPQGGYLHAMHRSLWGDMHWRIEGKTSDGQLKLVGGWQNNRQMGAHREYRFVENVFEELDVPGEWFFDRKTRQLYCYPPAGVDLSRARVEVVCLKHLVEFRGTPAAPVRYIELRGLAFSHAKRTFMENREPLLRSDWTTYRGGALFFNCASDCAVRDCVVDQVGGNGLFVSGRNRRLEFTGCRIAHAGASAVCFVGDSNSLRSPLFEYHQTMTLEEMDKAPGPKTDDFPTDCLVEDCLIYANGRFEKQTAGVNICTARSITVRHCSIYDCPRAGINLCNGAFGGHLIEFCDVFDTVKETGDHGSFNSWGRDRFWHPKRDQTAEWVSVHPDMPKWDCQQKIVIRNNRWRCDHGWDIDLDDGSSNYEIFNNLCLAGGIKLREGYFRNVYNNILVNYTFCPHVWYPDCHTSFRNNIIWQESYAPAGMRATDQGAAIDKNLVHEADAEPRAATRLAPFGGDADSLVADAQFLDPLAGDYRVSAESPAKELGFKNFAMDRFGVRKPELKGQAKSPPLPGTLAAATIRSGGWGRQARTPQRAFWRGAELKQLETDGEQSAVGLGDKRGVLVEYVPPESAAHTAGLRSNDVVRAIDGRQVAHLQDFAAMLQQRETSPSVTFEVWRDQQTLRLQIAVK